MTAKVYATARVHLTVEVLAASWDPASSAEQIFKAAGEEAKNKLERMFHKESDISIVGEPIVKLVTGLQGVQS